MYRLAKAALIGVPWGIPKPVTFLSIAILAFTISVIVATGEQPFVFSRAEKTGWALRSFFSSHEV
jgi:hypothetical protein